MNARARLVDAWRQVDYNANPLKSALDIDVNGAMGTLARQRRLASTAAPACCAWACASTRRSIASPSATITARRSSTTSARGASTWLFEDRMSQSLRNTLRIVKLSQFNFEIRRSAVQVAISQVDLARLRLEEPPRPGAVAQFGATTARDLVSALNDLLDSQNDFLSLQVGYDVLRMVLDFELGTMRTDRDGLWIDPGADHPRQSRRQCPELESRRWRRKPESPKSPRIVLPSKAPNLTAR